MGSPRPSATTHVPVFQGREIRSRLVAMAVLASLMAGLVTGGAALFVVYAPLAQRVEETHSLALRFGAEQLLGFLDGAQREIGALAAEPRLLAVAGGHAGEAAVSDALASLLARSTSFVGLLAFSRTGEVLASSGAGMEFEALLARIQIQNAPDVRVDTIIEAKQLRRELGGVVQPMLRVVEPGAASLILAASPLPAEGDAPIATLVGLVRTDRLARHLRGDLLGGNSDVLLVDAQGRVVAAGRGARSASQDPFAAVAAPAQSECRVRIGYRAESGWSAGCARPLGALGLSLVSVQPAREAFAPLVLLPPIILLASGLVVVFVAWASAASVGARLIRPLSLLYTGLAAAGRGDLSVELSEGRARGDAESLIVAFNGLLRSLREKTLEIETSRRALEEQNQAFQQQNETISKLSVTDALTSLHNRRFFQEQLDREIRRLTRHGKGLSLLIADVDDFKKLNDTYGHAAGDEFLKQIAAILKECVRATDVVARYGGEEFVVVATGTLLEGAGILAEKLRTAIAEASFIVDDSMRPRRATVSIGVAEFKGSQSEMFNAADAALYRAKHSGKNCVMTTADE